MSECLPHMNECTFRMHRVRHFAMSETGVNFLYTFRMHRHQPGGSCMYTFAMYILLCSARTFRMHTFRMYTLQFAMADIKLNFFVLIILRLFGQRRTMRPRGLLAIAASSDAGP